MLQKNKILFSLISIYSIFNINYVNVLKAEIENNEIKIGDNDTKNLSINENLYILGPGDIVMLDFISMPEWSDQTIILNDGKIQLPIVGSVKVSGKSLIEAKEEIEKSLSDELIRPDVQIRIIKARPLRISIIGEITKPGLYTFSSNSNQVNLSEGNSSLIGAPTLFDAIKKAGGITNESNLSNISLKRKLPTSNENSYKQTSLNLISLIKKGDQTQNPFLFDGDVIKIKKAPPIKNEEYGLFKTNLSPSKINVTIAGEVNKPGRYSVKSSSSLNELVMHAGGLKYSRANRYNINLIRIRSNGTISKESFKFKLNADVSDKNNPKLNDDDIVQVRRNLLAQTGDSIQSITSPLSGIVTTFSLFKILND